MLESLTGQQEEMISSLTQAITESVNNQKVVVESFFSEMTGEVDASFEQTNGTLDSVEKTAEVGKDQLLSMQEQHTKELKKNEKAISKIEKSFGKSLEKCDDLCTEATETVQTDIASAAESEEKHTQEIGALLENAQSSIKEAVAAIEECVASGQAGLDESISDVKDTLTDTANKERESLQKVSDISAEQAKCLNEGSKSSMDLVSELGETIKEHASNVKPDLATGQTPAKRTIELPKNGFLQSLCTPAPEVVLEEYRNQKESRGTQTPTKDNQRKEETTEDDLEDAADAKENEEGVEATPTKGDLSLTSTESERQPLSSVINSPSTAAA
jgi:uncharacterized protein YjaG (DUF416 family)